MAVNGSYVVDSVTNQLVQLSQFGNLGWIPNPPINWLQRFKNMINEFKNKYLVQEIGIPYSDMIIAKEDFISAVKEINAFGYYIVEISWWKHNKIKQIEAEHSMGGPIDKNNNEYYFGETNHSKTFEKNSLNKNLEQVINYYLNFIRTDESDLLPALTLDIAYKY